MAAECLRNRTLRLIGDSPQLVLYHLYSDVLHALNIIRTLVVPARGTCRIGSNSLVGRIVVDARSRRDAPEQDDALAA